MILNRIDINITSRDRATEIFGLLVSLQHQTYQEFDIYILDDASGTPLGNFYFFSYICQRLRYEGHRIHLLRNEKSKGVCKARQQLQDYSMKRGRGELICRLDDDTVLEPDYLEKLMVVIETGFDMASGVTPPLGAPENSRSIRFVSPVINRIVLGDDGGFLVNSDDCGIQYNEAAIIPADHFRSNCLYKKTVCVAAHYKDILAVASGFREETFFSLRAIIAGFKLGVHTKAIAWHLMTPSGGERRQDFGQYALMNQQLLNRKVKMWYEQYGDFIKNYHQNLEVLRLKQPDDSLSEKRTQRKNTNLLYSLED